MFVRRKWVSCNIFFRKFLFSSPKNLYRQNYSLMLFSFKKTYYIFVQKWTNILISSRIQDFFSNEIDEKNWKNFWRRFQSGFQKIPRKQYMTILLEKIKSYGVMVWRFKSLKVVFYCVFCSVTRWTHVKSEHMFLP